MKKYFNKEFSMDREDGEELENSTKCRICDISYIEDDVKVRNHCHITVKYRNSAHKDCNINVKLNHKLPAVFTT